jgi:predicted nucleotidyltransferase
VDDELIDGVRRALLPIAEVRVAYLFGSRAGGRPHPGSDLDVAVAFAPSLGDEARLRARLAVVAALTARPS